MKRLLRLSSFTATLCACVLPATRAPSQPVVLTYEVASSPWSLDHRGDQRAVVSVKQASSAVRVDIPWRRRDSNPQGKNIVVVDASTDAVVNNRVAIEISREKGSIVFEPQTVPGNYHIYYLPFIDARQAGFYEGDFVAWQNTASSAWLSANGLPGSAANLPKAAPLRIEARLPIDNFWPMEVPLTASELATIRSTNPAAYLVFPEDRLHPIKMRDELPYRWLAAQPGNSFTGTALRDEYYALQLGVYAVTQSIQNVRVIFSDLQRASGGSIPASAFNCLNLGGTNWDGSTFTKAITVDQGTVQPLWMGLLVPSATSPGLYTGTVTVSAENAPSKVINLAITVGTGTAVEHGDNMPANHSRLRWMDSQLGVSDQPTPPYTPMSVSNHTVGVLGRALIFDSRGLPSSIRAGGNEILEAPIEFGIVSAGRTFLFTNGTPVVTFTNEGRVHWQATSTAGAFTMESLAQMEFDGLVKYRLTIRVSGVAPNIKGVLSIPLTAEASKFMVGLGYDGGARPSAHSWSWSTPHNSVWLGGVRAGLQTKFLGSSYTGPMLHLYSPAPPATWGGGSVLVTDFGDGALLKADTGTRTITASSPIQIEFALLPTPVKPVDPILQFGERYYHDSGSPAPPTNSDQWGVNIINVHQGNSVNPHINWPFSDPTTLSQFVSTQQQKGSKVSVYYTLRELTQHTAEIWALRGLGDEVIQGGSGGGFPWLREHFGGDYTPNMYTPLSGGKHDAAVVTRPNSRYDNYYVEGVNWLARHANIDGVYLDDSSLDRSTLKRARCVLEQHRLGARIDLHSCTCLVRGPINQYLDCLPYLDRLWFGENFFYDTLTPEQWLVQVSGIPFGPMGEMLQGGGNPWLGAVFGLTSRYGHSNPLPVWSIWDRFGGLTNATMLGWWEANPPVTANDENVKVTAFVKKGKTLLAVGNFSASQTTVTLNINWAALGLDPSTCTFYAPEAIGFQSQGLFQPGDSITIPAKKGRMFIVQPDGAHPIDIPELLAHYRMSETSGTTALDETGRYHGQYVGRPALGSGNVPGTAAPSLRSVAFSGGQWMRLPATLADTAFRSGDSWTISFWVRPSLPSPSHNATFVWTDNTGIPRGVLFYLEANGSLDFWLGDGVGWNGTPNFNPGGGIQDKWYHIAAVCDGNSIMGYLNGRPFESRPVASFLYPNAGQPITVGSRPGNSPQYDLRGKMTDVRVYSGILSDQNLLLLAAYPGRRVPADATNPSYSTVSLRCEGEDMVLSLPAVASWQYQWETASDLFSSDWTPLGPPLTAPPATDQIAITNHFSISESNRFYRARILR